MGAQAPRTISPVPTSVLPPAHTDRRCQRLAQSQLAAVALPWLHCTGLHSSCLVYRTQHLEHSWGVTPVIQNLKSIWGQSGAAVHLDVATALYRSALFAVRL